MITRVFDIVQRAITQNVTYSEKAKEVQNITNTEKANKIQSQLKGENVGQEHPIKLTKEQDYNTLNNQQVLYTSNIKSPQPKH